MEERGRHFPCSACGFECRVGDSETCPGCKASLQVAKLVCTISPGPGAESGEEWILMPCEYDIGRHHENDIVLGDEFVSRHHLKLLWMNGAFYAKNMSANRNPDAPEFYRLEDGDFLSLGRGKLKLSYILPEQSISLDKLQQTLQAVYELQFTSTLVEACREVLLDFLKLTELEKGYVFAFRFQDNEVLMDELAGTRADGEPLPPRDYRISQSILSRVLERRGEPLIYTDDMENSPASSSIVAFKLKTIVCVPLLNDEDQTVGIIYGDSRRLATHELTQFKPVLVTLAKLLVLQLKVLDAGQSGSFLKADNYHG